MSNVKFIKPHLLARSSDIKSASVEQKPLTPTMVRKMRGNYEAEMSFDIKFILTPHKVVNDKNEIIN